MASHDCDNIDSGSELLPKSHQAIAWACDDIPSVAWQEQLFETAIKIYKCSVGKLHLKM